MKKLSRRKNKKSDENFDSSKFVPFKNERDPTGKLLRRQEKDIPTDVIFIRKAKKRNRKAHKMDYSLLDLYDKTSRKSVAGSSFKKDIYSFDIHSSPVVQMYPGSSDNKLYKLLTDTDQNQRKMTCSEPIQFGLGSLFVVIEEKL